MEPAVIWWCVIETLSVYALVALAVSARDVIGLHRPERNLRALLGDEPEREYLARMILQNPSAENIQKGRDLVLRVAGGMSLREQRTLSRGLCQDSIRGQARYVAKLLMG